MPVVLIAEIGQAPGLVRDGPNSRRLFSVTNRTAKNGLRQQSFEITPTQGELMNDIRWYLEDFAARSPLETKRAHRSKTALKKVGKALVKSIDWSSVIEPDERKESLVVYIQEQISPSAPVMWELLEDSELWNDPFEGGVFVSRYIDGAEKMPATTPTKLSRTNPSALNILVVSARPFEADDIPPRIVSKILQKKIRNQSDQLISPTSFKILRPPTWEEFKRELETKAPSFYDIVHFDMHGVRMDDNRQGLAFVENDPERFGQYRMQKVLTSDVASVLALHGVRRVVLNACRSAHYQDADQSMALGILKSHVEECVAMTFNVLSRSVEIFMAIFYDAVLTKGLAFDASAAWARQALRLKPGRTSRYATDVHVYDYMIPVCYTNILSQGTEAFSFTGRSLQFPRKAPFGDLVGRETDIMSLETCLLISNKVPFIWGRPGVGKTTLLRHLSSWWQETGLATGVHIYDCQAMPGWNIDNLWLSILDQIQPNVVYRGPDSVVEHLSKNRWIIILDGLPASPQRPCLRFVSQVLTKLHGTCTKVILAARSISEDKWKSLAQYTGIRYGLRGLDMLSSLQLLRTYMKKAMTDLTDETPKSVGESSEDLHCFEQIARLLDGNPAALRVVVSMFLFSRTNTLKEFLESLMLGEPMMERQAAQQHLLSMGQAENLPCVTELNGIIQDLLHPPAGKYSVPVEVLALFWGLISRGDLSTFIAAYADHVSKDLSASMPLEDYATLMKTLLGEQGTGALESLGLPSELKKQLVEMVHHSNSWMKSDGMKDLLKEALNDPQRLHRSVGQRSHFLIKGTADYAQVLKQSPLSNHFEAACDRVIDPLKNAHFLDEDCQRPASRSAISYYRVHPLVPLLLRASPMYHCNVGFGIKREHIKKAFVFYYAYRAREWPFEHQYFEPQWQSVRQELFFEFINFMSASAMCSEMVKDMPTITMETLIPFTLVTALHRGISREFSRFQLAHIALEKVLTCVLWQEKRISDSGVSDPEQKQILFLLRMYGTVAAFVRSSVPGPMTSEDNKPFSALSREIYQRMKKMGDAVAKDIFDRAEVGPAVMAYLDRTFRRIADPEFHSNENWDEMWELRREFMKESAATTGDTVYASHNSWEDIPRHLLAGFQLKREMESAVQSAYSAMDSGELDEARKIVDQAWQDEVFKRTDDSLNRAQLLELRAKICELDGDWESGSEHRREAQQIRKMLADEAPSDVLSLLGAPAQESPVANLCSKLTTIAMDWFL